MALRSSSEISQLEFRNGIVINGPAAARLTFTFYEIWIEQVYCPPAFRIEPGHVVIDVGANVGLFAMYAATRAPNVSVVAYEPSPVCFDWLTSNVKQSQLNNVRLYQKAVAGANGTQVLKINEDNWLANQLDGADHGGAHCLIETVSLLQVLEDNGIVQCDLLKLDCEGSEYEILLGADSDALTKIRRIAGEYHDPLKGSDIARLLESRSFCVDHLQPSEGGGMFYAHNLQQPGDGHLSQFKD